MKNENRILREDNENSSFGVQFTQKAELGRPFSLWEKDRMRDIKHIKALALQIPLTPTPGNFYLRYSTSRVPAVVSLRERG